MSLSKVHVPGKEGRVRAGSMCAGVGVQCVVWQRGKARESVCPLLCLKTDEDTTDVPVLSLSLPVCEEEKGCAKGWSRQARGEEGGVGRRWQKGERGKQGV